MKRGHRRFQGCIPQGSEGGPSGPNLELTNGAVMGTPRVESINLRWVVGEGMQFGRDPHLVPFIDSFFFFFALDSPRSLSAPISAPRRSGCFPCTTTPADMIPRGRALITRPRTPPISVRESGRHRESQRATRRAQVLGRRAVLFEESGISSRDVAPPLPPPSTITRDR